MSSKRYRFDDSANDAPTHSVSYVAMRQPQTVVKSTGFRKAKKKVSKKDMALMKSMRSMVKKMIELPKQIKICVSGASGTIANWVTGASGTAYNISFADVDEGLDWNGRIGRQIELKKVMFNFSLTSPATAGDVLVAVLMNTDNPAGDVSNSTVDTKIGFAGATQAMTSATGIVDLLLPWNNQAWKVMFEEVFQMSQTDLQTGSAYTIYRSVNLTKGFPKKIQFDTAATSAGCPQMTAVFIPLSTGLGLCPYKATSIVEYTNS